MIKNVTAFILSTLFIFGIYILIQSYIIHKNNNQKTNIKLASHNSCLIFKIPKSAEQESDTLIFDMQDTFIEKTETKNQKEYSIHITDSSNLKNLHHFLKKENDTYSTQELTTVSALLEKQNITYSIAEKLNPYLSYSFKNKENTEYQLKLLQLNIPKSSIAKITCNI